ncbi:MAG: hypothetical protein IJW36_01885 [Clostridia bacterium]|nr:hypothetical protein [Clostridia bacterium]
MYYCKELNSMAVLSLFEGELLGKVDKLFFDKKLKKLNELELIGEDGAKLTLPTKNIYRIGKNAITVKNNQAVSLKQENAENFPAPLNSKAYSINGEFLGIVEEVSINEKFFSNKVVLGNGTILNVENLASYGKNAIIFHDDEKKINIKNFMPNKTPKAFQTEEVKMVSTLPIEQTASKVVPIENVNSLAQNSDFLVGRICVKDIYNFNNEVLIKANTSITKKALKDITKFGKLRELMLFSK